ncbi:predicted protein [Postia placenta Mad-698-R]|nr:predicted protein [Postia placenta Mad-698-R]
MVSRRVASFGRLGRLRPTNVYVHRARIPGIWSVSGELDKSSDGIFISTIPALPPSTLLYENHAPGIRFACTPSVIRPVFLPDVAARNVSAKRAIAPIPDAVPGCSDIIITPNDRGPAPPISVRGGIMGSVRISTSAVTHAAHVERNPFDSGILLPTSGFPSAIMTQASSLRASQTPMLGGLHETHLKLIILEGRRTRAHNEVVRYIWHKA